MSSTSTLFDSLQQEFCPPLDSSLLAALLVDIELDNGGNPITPTLEQINGLRATLKELSLQADESQLSEFSYLNLTSQVEDTVSSRTTPSFSIGLTSSGAAGSSGASASSSPAFGSPLGFLQTALPDIPISKLKLALEENEGDEIDLWDVIANILTEESIRDLEERGLDDGEVDFALLPSEEMDWETVKRRKKASIKASAKKKAQPRPKKIALADVRQQHHVQMPSPAASPSTSPLKSAKSSGDPWTQVSSLASHMSKLLPPHPPTAFSSFFHSPNYASSYESARAAMTSLCKPTSELSDRHTAVLFSLLDIVLPEYEELDLEQRSRVTSDVELAVSVTEGREDDALDIFYLLRDLDTDVTLGVQHLTPQPSTSSKPDPFTSEDWKDPPVLSSVRSHLPTGPPNIPPPPSRGKRAPSPSNRNKPSIYQWQAVPQRSKNINRRPHSLAHHIPAYSRDVNGNKTNRRHGSLGDQSSYSPGDFRLRMHKALERRNRALMDAAAMWQKGNMKNRGGDVALYYAERAREMQHIAKQEALNAARAMVLSHRAKNPTQNTIDLHGTTVAEAIVIVKEILNEQVSSISQAQPMKIVTGKGTHSAGRVSVLKPAVRNALIEDGWDVHSWEAGLTVRPRRT